MTAGPRSEPLEPLEPLEIALGRPLERAERAWNHVVDHRHPREALEAEVLAAALRGQLYVSFSGGRDSSLILAVACHVTRREGLPSPIPVTMVHSSAESDESEWQQLVMSHLDLREWLRFDIGGEMDLLGPDATALLRHTGVMSPPNAYLHLPMLSRSSGGVLLTGAGGDEVLGSRASHLARFIWRRETARPARALQSALLAAAPQGVRRSWKRRELEVPPWLRPEAGRQVIDQVARNEAAVPVRWDRAATRWAVSRTVALGEEALRKTAAFCRSEIVNPLMSPSFISAFAREVGPAGPVGRSEAMTLLASDVLPSPVLQRPTKAIFGAVVWGTCFRRFVSEWDGRLIPALEDLVHTDELRRAWDTSTPDFASMMLAQQAWLIAHGSSGGAGDQQVD